MQHNYLNLNSSKCIIASQKRHPVVPIYKLHIGDDIIEQVESYRYLGVTITSKLDWTQYINHVATKARKLVGMLYRKYYTWTDIPVLRCLYLTCIWPHLEYACQLWDPFTQNGINTLESVQKLVCKVCLKRWDLDWLNACTAKHSKTNNSKEVFETHYIQCIVLQEVIIIFLLAFLYKIAIVIIYVIIK